MDLSVVVPVYNEEESLEQLHRRLTEALAGLDRSYELIFVDDGSRDASFEVLQRLRAADGRVRVVRLRRNFGQTAAFSAGFDRAKGDVIVTLDADLQNDPADIPALLAKIQEGYDVVSGWRRDRQDRFLDRRLPSTIANGLISWVTGVHLHDYGCSLKAYRRDVLSDVRLYGELHRFLPALAHGMGARVAELPVSHFPRRFGRSKYGISRTLKVLLDLLAVKFLLSYSTRPIHIFGLLGIGSLSVGTILLAYLGVVRVFLHQDIGDRPLVLLAILLTIFGAQLVTSGLLAELVIRTYYEAQGKPIYTVRDDLGGTDTDGTHPGRD
ncbi:MAG TPA: glycosyltransferase family 2 protein [Anaerolineae bacterium]|nr:glycosyltransferase family 2 protein [Anaerolineae bacterium]